MHLDVAFARCVDHLSLSGSSGTFLHQLVASSFPNPRPSLLNWFLKQFKSRPHLFSSPDWDAPHHQLLVVAHLNLRKRALGLNALEQVPLPDRAFLILEQVGTAGVHGVLQSDLAPRVNLTPVVVSHYVKNLAGRRLLVKRKVVLRNEKDAHRPSTVTYTAMIWLARFSAMVDRKRGMVDACNNPHHVQGRSTQSHPSGANGMQMHTIDFRRGGERILAALRNAGGVMAQRDLKLIAMPDNERPQGFSVSDYNRKRHRMFRTYRDKLVKMGLLEEVKTECVSENGKSRGVLDCLRLKDQAQQCHVDSLQAAGGPSHMEEEDGWESARMGATPNRDNSKGAPVCGKRGKYLAEVDLVEQVYQLLREAGPKGMTVPEIRAHLDGGCGLTIAPSKRLWNIIDGLSRFRKVVRSQRFTGSVMELTHVLVDSSSKAGADQSQSQGGAEDTSNATVVVGDEGRGPKSKLARRKDEMTSLGLQRQEMVMELLHEKKAVIQDTLGRKVAEKEGTGLQRVDQKVMKRVINGLVEQKRIQVITTIKPTVKESRQLQTVKLVVLPGLTTQSPEVAALLAAICTGAQHGNGSKQPKKDSRKKTLDGEPIEICAERTERKARVRRKKRKRVSDEKTIASEKRDELEENETREGQINGNRGGKSLMGEKSLSSDFAEGEDLLTIDTAEGVCPALTESTEKGHVDVVRPRKKRKVVVRTSENRDSKIQRISRLTSILYGVMKGKMARLKAFHEELFQIVTANRESQSANIGRSLVQHSSIEEARSAPATESFELYSCIKEMTVGSYAATIGIYRDIGDNFDEIRHKKVREVPEIWNGDKEFRYATTRIKGLTKLLVQLGLLVCQKDAKFSLCGAGILRNFGRGMPRGVFPHGIVFSNRESVSTYWRELFQYSLCGEAKLQQIDMDLNGELSPKSAQVPSFEVREVYFRSSWYKSLMLVYSLSDQIKFEAALQRANGVSTVQDSSGRYNTTNFVTTSLRRFSIAELVEQVENVSTDYDLHSSSTRIPAIAEKLLLYSRYRTENDMPAVLHSTEKLVDNSSSHILRLYRGPPNQRPAEAIRSTGRPQRGIGGRSQTKKPDKPLVQDAQPLEIKVSMDDCVSMLREIVIIRALNHCKTKGWMTSWPIAEALGKSSGAGRWNRSRGDGNASDMSQEEERGRSCRRIVADLCACASAQVILECLSLKLAYGVAVERDECCLAEEFDFEDVCRRLQGEWREFDDIIRVAAYESEARLYSGCRIAFETESVNELNVACKREGFLEREFRLELMMRMHRAERLSKRIEMLSERYRLLVELRMSDSLVHEFIVRSGVVDDVGRVEDEQLEALRVEVVEVLLICILNEGRQAQTSGQVLKLLEGIRRVDIAMARDRLVLRGEIKLYKGISGGEFFEICKNVRGEGNAVSLKGFEQAEKEWRREIVEGEGARRFRETKLGEAVMSENIAESTLGTMGLVKMACGEGGRLRLMPVIGDQGVLIGYDGEQECETMLDMMVSHVMDNCKDRRDCSDDDNRKETAEGQCGNKSELVKVVQDSVEGRRGMGATLGEIFAVGLQHGYTKREEMMEAIGQLQAGGDVIRMAIENEEEGEWCGAGSVVMVGREFLRAWTSVCEGRGGPSVWGGVSGGEGCLADEVASRVLHVVRRNSGIGVGAVVSKVQERFGGVCGRVIGDLVYALARRGVLTVRRVVEEGGGRGVFSNRRFRAERGWVESGGVDYVGSDEWCLEVNFGTCH